MSPQSQKGQGLDETGSGAAPAAIALSAVDAEKMAFAAGAAWADTRRLLPAEAILAEAARRYPAESQHPFERIAESNSAALDSLMSAHQEEEEG